MKLLSFLMHRSKQKRKTLADQQQELLVRQGREQFKKLLDRGLQIPIVLL